MTDTLTRSGTNWEDKLLSDDISIRKEDGREVKVVYLRGLQRLAHLAGLVKSHCTLNFISKNETGSFGIMQAIYELEFNDGTLWVGCADCNSENTNGKFIRYPTAVAESRAEARALRKALNIGIISSEEIGFTEGGAAVQMESSPSKAIDPQVIKAIEKLCETRDCSVAEVLDAILSKDRNGSVFELSELTVEEGQKAMAWLNEQKPAKKTAVKMTAVEERDARKKELLEKAKDAS